MIPGLPNLYLAGALALASFFGGAWLTHRIDLVSYQKLELHYAQAEKEAAEKARAEQERLDNLAVQAAQGENRRQAKIAATVQSQLRKVKVYVKRLEDERGCIPLGVVRLFDAAVHGVEPERLPLPAGKSASSCSGLVADDLARSLVGNYGTARANASQLNALIDLIRSTKK